MGRPNATWAGQGRSADLLVRSAITSLVALAALLVVVAGVGPVGVGTVSAGPPADADGVPGGGDEIRLARPTWDTGWFQAEIAAQLLAELGYTVTGPSTMENAEFYDAVADGSVDLWVNGWFPLHEPLLGGRDEVVPIGLEVDGGALQGYMADLASIERLGIDDLADLADPDVAAEFDIDGDGLADLIGCNREWACGPIVDHHLAELGLTGTVEQVQGDHGPLMRNTVERFESGDPVLYYNFTPNWTTGELVPGEDVAWLPVRDATLPEGAAGDSADAVVADVRGCLADPCPMGFPPNDIRAVASASMLDTQPAIESLLESFTIPLRDISDQNARMASDRADADDIELHASEWIVANRDRVDDWLEAAIDAHLAAGLELAEPPAGTDPTASPVGPLDVVTRLSPPFVTYDDNRYGGFSIELWELVADRIGATSSTYAVNSSPKLVDEVLRGTADVGVGAIGMTSDREGDANFSHPYIDTGLQVMITADDDGLLGGAFGNLLRRIFSWQLLTLVVVLFAALLVAAHVIWLSERGRSPDFPSDYRRGIWEAFWWAAVTATTVGYGDRTPKGKAGRVVAIVWMFTGLFLLAYFTAGIATTLAIDELEDDISGPDDLQGHTVAVPSESVAATFLDRSGVPTVEYDTASETYEALVAGDVDAVVHDAAILQHHVRNDGEGRTRVVGLPFHQQRYGFVVDVDDPLRERINVALLELAESGEYAELYERWFGRSSVGGGRT